MSKDTIANFFATGLIVAFMFIACLVPIAVIALLVKLIVWAVVG